MASWGPLTTPSAVAVDTMLLLTDGGVMCHVYGTANWHKLVPDAQGDYVNGTWQSLASMPANAPTTQNGPTDAPLYYASAVLKDGRVFVAGGEYNVNYASGVDLLAVEIYDPVSDSWSSLPNPPGWTNIGDVADMRFAGWPAPTGQHQRRRHGDLRPGREHLVDRRQQARHQLGRDMDAAAQPNDSGRRGE